MDTTHNTPILKAVQPTDSQDAVQLIIRMAREQGLKNILCAGSTDSFPADSAIAGINTFDLPEETHRQFNRYCFERSIPVLYPFDMGWGAVVAVATAHSLSLNDAINIKTGNYNDDIRGYIARYASFWSRETPESLLQRNSPEYSSILMLQMSLQVLLNLAAEKTVKPFPHLYYTLCNPME